MNKDVITDELDCDQNLNSKKLSQNWDFLKDVEVLPNVEEEVTDFSLDEKYDPSNDPFAAPVDFENRGHKNPFLNDDKVYEVIQYYRDVNGKSKHAYFYDVEKEARIYQKPLKQFLKELRDNEKKRQKNKKTVAPGVKDLILYIIINLPFVDSNLRESESSESLFRDLSRSTIKNELGFDKSKWYTSISYLKKNNLIANKDEDNKEYWINPKYVFPGNRIKYIEFHAPDKIKVTRRNYLAV